MSPLEDDVEAASFVEFFASLAGFDKNDLN